MVPSENTWHVSRGQKRVVKLVIFFVQNLQKPYMFDLVTHSPLTCDALGSICHIGGLWAPLKNCFMVLHPARLLWLVWLRQRLEACLNRVQANRLDTPLRLDSCV